MFRRTTVDLFKFIAIDELWNSDTKYTIIASLDAKYNIYTWYEWCINIIDRSALELQRHSRPFRDTDYCASQPNRAMTLANTVLRSLHKEQWRVSVSGDSHRVW